MKLKFRAMFLGMGILALLYGFGMLQAGVLTYQNGKGQTLFPAGTIVAGIFFILVGFLPSKDFLSRPTTARRTKSKRLHHGENRRSPCA